MPELKILKTTVDIGLGHEVKVLHVTDSHIALDDEGDERGRFKYFSNAEEYFHQTCAYAKENGLTMLNTGDLLDAHTESNFAFADKYLLPTDTIYAAGNHDFCHFDLLLHKWRKQAEKILYRSFEYTALAILLGNGCAFLQGFKEVVAHLVYCLRITHPYAAFKVKV